MILKEDWMCSYAPDLNVQTVHLVKNVGEIAKQIVIAVIKGQGFVKTVVNLDGKATIVEKLVQKEHSVRIAMRHAVVIAEMQDFVDQIQVTVMKGVQKVGEAFFATKFVTTKCMEKTANRNVVTAPIPPTAIMSTVSVQLVVI